MDLRTPLRRTAVVRKVLMTLVMVAIACLAAAGCQAAPPASTYPPAAQCATLAMDPGHIRVQRRGPRLPSGGLPRAWRRAGAPRAGDSDARQPARGTRGLTAAGPGLRTRSP